MRDRAVAYVAERVRSGVGAAEITEELGVRKATVIRWMYCCWRSLCQQEL